MLRQHFAYQLPQELIAQFPPKKRGDSRLLAMACPSGHFVDLQFADFLRFLKAGDLLVFNDTRVLLARLLGHKESGGKVEVLLQRIINDRRFLACTRTSKTLKDGTVVYLPNKMRIQLHHRQGDFFVFDVLDSLTVNKLLQCSGHVPLPPYIHRLDQLDDMCRYQTVYARVLGAVAAPTAGLHFTTNLISAIRKRGVVCAFITLHVGSGTFQPVRVDNILQHRMHSETLSVSADVCDQIKATRARGNRIIAVGTTIVRALETIAMHCQTKILDDLQPFQGETDIFIYPGYEFKAVDALLTNFHLSESTLLMLVSAFSGKDNILKAYQHAIDKRYRFFSYGDAMFLHNEAT